MQIFTKYNNTNFQDSLLKEAAGLSILYTILEDNEYLNVPEILSVDKKSLKLQKVDIRTFTKKLSANLGIGLALLHKQQQKNYGFYDDNYIGLNPQKNIISDNWGEFFVEYRLKYQISLISDQNIQNKFSDSLERSQEKIINFLNKNCSHPSLVHGDLWSGNVLCDASKIWLIDPAVYYGDREVDIAMSLMFGGFSKEFYDAYDSTYILSDQFDKKVVIYNLYHYLNHYNLFGGYYLSDCKDGFKFIENQL